MGACASCGEQLPANAKFCGGCGAAVVEAPACPDCGAAIQPGWEFCGACGARLTASDAPPAPAPAQPVPVHVAPLPPADPAVAATSAPRMRRSRTPLIVGGVLALTAVAAAVVAVVVFLGGDDGDAALAFGDPPRVDQDVVAALDRRFAALPKPNGDTDRDQVRDLIGPPDAFIVSWESVGSEPEPVRYETWFYYELLTAYEFADGRLIGNLPIDDEEAVLLLPLQYDPAKFEREMRWEDVSKLVADPSLAVRTQLPQELEIAVTAYVADQLLVAFDESGLVYVEAIPLRGGTP